MNSQGIDQYYAHSENRYGQKDTLRHHLSRVSDRAAEMAEAFGMADEARIAGLLHDLGKYGDLFQRRLEGTEHGIDHWSAGAWEALNRFHSVSAALSIQGHHIGLQQGAKGHLVHLEPQSCALHIRPLRLAGPHDELLARMQADHMSLGDGSTVRSAYAGLESVCDGMLDVRLLYSTLVDADFLETADHFSGLSSVQPAAPLNPERALSIVQAFASSLRDRSTASDGVNDMRSELFRICCQAGAQPPGLFTLTAPTGAGKTLAMLAFALSHALQNGLRRIVVVLPYLTIIEQTASVYEAVFGHDDVLGPFDRYVIEDHSLAGTRYAQPTNLDEHDLNSPKARARIGEARTWDAPIVITTSVQMLESLFAGRPGPCRKLHYLPSSVILFDEVQTLPLRLAIPTLATLSRLSDAYGASVVFSTATQPAFTHLDRHVRIFGSAGWAPREIVTDHRSVFTSMKRRVHVDWPQAPNRAWTDVARDMLECNASLCVVNLKRHAAQLFTILHALDGENAFHISTNMCSLHRQDVLRAVRARLEAGQPCRLVATQCIEAGVDLDFPRVLRALGPLDAIAQAAGRCNRNGRTDSGLVRVFVPEDESYPDESYRRATSVTRSLLLAAGPDGPDLQDPDTYNHYYRALYDLSQPEKSGTLLRDALTRQDFPEVSRLYRLIPKDAINVVVPYDQPEFAELASMASHSEVDRQWIHNARPHSVSIFKPEPGDPVFSYVSTVTIAGGSQSNEWYLWCNPNSYDSQLGLVIPSTSRCTIA